MLALPGSGITSAADLAGKTVAVNLTNNIQTLTLNAILKASGAPGQPDYVAIPFTEMGAALKAHRVAAISVVEPYITAYEKTDGAVPSWVKQNPGTIDVARLQQLADLMRQQGMLSGPFKVSGIVAP